MAFIESWREFLEHETRTVISVTRESNFQHETTINSTTDQGQHTPAESRIASLEWQQRPAAAVRMITHGDDYSECSNSLCSDGDDTVSLYLQLTLMIDRFRSRLRARRSNAKIV